VDGYFKVQFNMSHSSEQKLSFSISIVQILVDNALKHSNPHTIIKTLFDCIASFSYAFINLSKKVEKLNSIKFSFISEPTYSPMNSN